jgi:hypothetical protein
MTSPLVGVVLIVVVGVVAFVLRRSLGSRDESVSLPATDVEPGPAHDAGVPVEPDDDEEDDGLHLALTSDGLAFAPQGRGVLIAPQRHFHRAPRGAADDGSGAPPAGESEQQHPILLSPGDLVAARVVRGSPDLDPWRLETLGRDRDLAVWPFETRDAAEAAHALLDQRIVRPVMDAGGEPVPVGDADFEEAQDALERTLSELNADLPDDDDPAGGSGR